MEELSIVERDGNPQLVITHAPAEGTLVVGTVRGDGSAQVLKAHQWRWGRSLGAWYLPRTRDQRPKLDLIQATAQALREVGFEVRVEIQDGFRDVELVEADRIERQAQRVQALAAHAERAHEVADQGWQRHERAAANLPPGGEPIKIDHHSAVRHQRAVDQAIATALAAIKLDQAAAQADHRAAAAAVTTSFRYSPQTIARRIERLAAEHRAARRNGDTERVEHLAAQIDYWQSVRDEQLQSGQAVDYGPTTVRAGDQVRISGGWHDVVRANSKSVAVQTPLGTRRAPWTSVDDHRRGPREPHAS